MKLQIQGQNLRFRIDESELEQLLSGQELSNHTDLGEQGTFGQTLALHLLAETALQTSANAWRVLLPESQVREYVARLPCRQALMLELGSDSGMAIALHFEVDVRDSVRRRGPRKKHLPQDRSSAQLGPSQSRQSPIT